MNEQHRFWKPKFYMAAFVQLSGTIAMFCGTFLDKPILTGGEWIAASTLALGVFTAGSVVENKALLGSK
jgi:hypothetical protein